MVRCVSCLNEQETVQPRQEMTRDPKEVPTEPPEARGGARSSRQGTRDVMMEDVCQEMEKREAAIQEVLATLTQLNQRLEELEGQSRWTRASRDPTMGSRMAGMVPSTSRTGRRYERTLSRARAHALHALLGVTAARPIYRGLCSVSGARRGPPQGCGMEVASSTCTVSGMPR